MKKLLNKLREGIPFGENFSNKLAVGIATVIGSILLFSITKYSFFTEGDFGKKLDSFVTQICVWYDSGTCFTKQKILSGAEIAISPWVGWTGVAILIVLLGIIIFKLNLNKPEK